MGRCKGALSLTSHTMGISLWRGAASVDTFNQQVVQVKNDRYDDVVLET